MMEAKELAANYADRIVKEVQALDLLLSAKHEDVTVCGECGEYWNVCAGLYGDGAKAICPECGEYGEAYQIGEECSYCVAVKIANDTCHESRPEYPDAVEMLHALAEYAGESDDVEAYSPSVVEYANVYGIAFKALGELPATSRDGWTVTGWSMLRTVGGPNCSVIGDNSDFVAVRVMWDGSEIVRNVYAPAVSSAFMDLAQDDAMAVK
jgi:hypothetical protein